MWHRVWKLWPKRSVCFRSKFWIANTKVNTKNWIWYTTEKWFHYEPQLHNYYPSIIKDFAKFENQQEEKDARWHRRNPHEVKESIRWIPFWNLRCVTHMFVGEQRRHVLYENHTCILQVGDAHANHLGYQSKGPHCMWIGHCAQLPYALHFKTFEIENWLKTMRIDTTHQEVFFVYYLGGNES